MGFSRQEHWSGLPLPSPGDLPYPEVELTSPALQADSLLTEPPGIPCNWVNLLCFLGICIIHVSSHSISLSPWKPWFWHQYTLKWASQVALVEEPTCQYRRYNRRRFHPCVRKIPRRRTWHPTAVVLPGEFYGQRSLEGYSPEGHKELDSTEAT